MKMEKQTTKQRVEEKLNLIEEEIAKLQEENIKLKAEITRLKNPNKTYEELAKISREEGQEEWAHYFEAMSKVKTIARPNYELAFETPEGVMDLNTYIAWLGNKVLEIEKALKSKK